MAFQAKRKFKRLVQREGIKVVSLVGTEYATFEDLSAGGLQLWLDHAVEPNSFLSLEFNLRRSEPIRTLARVVYCAEAKPGYFKVGVEFSELSEVTRVSLETLIDSHDGPF